MAKNDAALDEFLIPARECIRPGDYDDDDIGERGCLLWAASHVPAELYRDFESAVVRRLGGLNAYRKLVIWCCPDTPANRRKMRDAFDGALRDLGYEIEDV